MDINIDTSELRGLVADLTDVPLKMRRNVVPVIKRGANEIRNDLSVQMAKSKHFKGFDDISYDIDGDGMGAEIGPKKGKPGSGANLAYFGTSRGGGTVEDPIEALMREYENLEKFLQDAVEGLL